MLRLLKTALLLIVVGMMCLPGMLCVYYEMAKREAREKMEKKLEKEQLVQLQLPADELHWYKPGKEIVHEGSLFDIKTIRIEDGIAYISGLYDQQETRIKENLHALQRKKEKDQGAGRLAYKWTSQTLFVEYAELPPLTPEGPEVKRFSAITVQYPTVYTDIIVPPPEL